MTNQYRWYDHATIKKIRLRVRLLIVLLLAMIIYLQYPVIISIIRYLFAGN